MSQLSLSDSDRPSHEVDARGRLELDDAFEVLSNRRRRYVVHHLLQCDETVDLRSLSRQVAAWENRKPLEEVSAEERRRVYNSLQQFHLPKLRDVGVVFYDSDRGTINSTMRTEDLKTYLGMNNSSVSYRATLVAGGFLSGGAAIFGLTGGGLPALGVVLLTGIVGVVAIQREQPSSQLGSEGPPPEIVRSNAQTNSFAGADLGGENGSVMWNERASSKQ